MQPEIQHLAPESLEVMMEQGIYLVDIRDQQSYQHSHIRGSYLINSDNFSDFLATANLDKALVVYCVHGISSIHAGNLFIEQGFDTVYSLTGGFKAMQAYPHLLE